MTSEGATTGGMVIAKGRWYKPGLIIGRGLVAQVLSSAPYAQARALIGFVLRCAPDPTFYSGTYRPPKLSVDDARGPMIAHPTAYLALRSRAVLQPGKTGLVNAGASGIRSAAVHLAKY